MKAGSQKPQDDRASHCWSIGSTNHPSSQSRKISIGVMIDSLPKKASEASKEREIAGVERTPPKQTQVISQVNSPWVSPKKFYEHATTTSELAASVPLFPSGTCDEDRPNKFTSVTYERKQKKNGATAIMQDFTFATAQPMINATGNDSTLGLRLRLHQILGAVSSPDSESPTPEFGAIIISPELKSDKIGNSIGKPRQSSEKQKPKSEQKGDALSKPTLGSDKQKQKVDRMVDDLFKPRQNSDTIETDSDCPDDRLERPVTRSLTRRRAPTKIPKKTVKSGKSSDEKLKHKEKTISSHTIDGGTSSMLTKRKYERKSSKAKPLNLFNGKDIAEKIQQATHLSVSPPPAPKTSTFDTKHSHSHTSDKERDCELKSIPKNNPNNPPLKVDQNNQYKDLDSPENRDQQEHTVTPSERRKESIVSPSVRKFFYPEDVLQSPTFGVDTPASSSFLSPMPKSDLIGEICGFSKLQSKQQDCYDNKQIESSDDMDDPKDPQPRKVSSVMKAFLMEASSDDNYSGSSEEDSSSSDENGSVETSPAKKLKSMLHPAKKLRDKGINVRLNHTKTSSPSIKGKRESNWIPKSAEHTEVDGLTRALELFALELGKLKSKIKLTTSKKSSEILMSVAEDVCLQLQKAETHIQTDMGKLKNLSKLKRKRVETRFEEQEERLQSIYAKFKEEINQHLQDCKSTFEGLEADQKEFKGTLEKQKSSHRKLVLQVEESIGIQLNDAQKKITATHEVAGEKMAQLKKVLGLCLKDGILG